MGSPPKLHRLLGLGLCLLSLSAATGCSGPLGRARHAFDEGRHPDAIAELSWLEPELGELSTRQRARYALLRGLTHLACGDARQAKRWLSDARARASADPGVYSSAERGELAAAWRSMGLMPSEAAPAGPEPIHSEVEATLAPGVSTSATPAR